METKKVSYLDLAWEAYAKRFRDLLTLRQIPLPPPEQLEKYSPQFFAMAEVFLDELVRHYDECAQVSDGMAQLRRRLQTMQYEVYRKEVETEKSRVATILASKGVVVETRE